MAHGWRTHEDEQTCGRESGTSPQPGEPRAAAKHEPGEQRRMLGYPPSRGPILTHDECGDDGCGQPSTRLGQFDGDARLGVQAPNGVLCVVDAGFHLRHEECLAGSVKGQHVDAAAIAEAVEADLDRHLPLPRCQRRRQPVLDCGVILIPEGIHSLAVEEKLQREVRVQRSHAVDDRAEGDLVESVPFDPRDGRLRKASGGSQVTLPPTSSTAEEADIAADPSPGHRASIARGRYRAVIGRSPPPALTCIRRANPELQ